jgi:hypothetical protein
MYDILWQGIQIIILQRNKNSCESLFSLPKTLKNISKGYFHLKSFAVSDSFNFGLDKDEELFNIMMNFLLQSCVKIHNYALFLLKSIKKQYCPNMPQGILYLYAFFSDIAIPLIRIFQNIVFLKLKIWSQI